MPSSSAVGSVGWDSRWCWPKSERRSWFWSSTIGPEDAVTRSLRKALNLMLVRKTCLVSFEYCLYLSYVTSKMQNFTSWESTILFSPNTSTENISHKTQLCPHLSCSGIHYIGDLQDHKPFRCMLDQITNGQLQWEPLENPFDHVVLGPPENRRRYPIYSGRTRFPEELKKCFPGEEKAIDEYLKLAKVGCRNFTGCDKVS